MVEPLRIPEPYRRLAYGRPAAPLHYAQRVTTPDGAELATFVYGPGAATLGELLSGTPVLALHGNGGTHATFTAVIDRLVAAGRGVCLAPGFLNDHSGQFAWIPFDCNESFSCVLCTHKNDHRPALSSFLHILKDLYDKAVAFPL